MEIERLVPVIGVWARVVLPVRELTRYVLPEVESCHCITSLSLCISEVGVGAADGREAGAFWGASAFDLPAVFRPLTSAMSCFATLIRLQFSKSIKLGRCEAVASPFSNVGTGVEELDWVDCLVRSFGIAGESWGGSFPDLLMVVPITNGL